jgi:PAS domain S-box-containing protein
MKEENKKKIILCLRWTILIVTSYLILFANGEITPLYSTGIFILLYILSNFVLSFLPSAWFSNLKLFYFIALFDTGMVSLGMYLSENATTDFYLIFFLVIILCSVSRSYGLLMVMSAMAALFYGVFLYTRGLLSSELAVSYTLRIPFIFIASTFYGYIVQTFTREKQQQLAVCENRYQGLFENAKEGILIFRNSEWRITDANREVERLTGYKRRDLLAKTFLDLIAPDDQDKATCFFQEVVQHTEGWTDSIFLMRSEGAPMEMDLSIKQIGLGEELFYQAMIRDLTGQRRLEKKIRESKRNLEAIFDGIPDQLSIQSSDYQVLRVNQAVINRYGTTFQNLIGKKCYEIYHGSSHPCEQCPVTTTLHTKQPATTIQRTSNGETTFRLFSYPILDDKGNVLSIIEHVQDITDEQRLQEQLIQSEKLAGIGILASGVAHEINNPLSGIIGMAELALEEEDDATKESYLKDILACGQRISEIVGGLRSYSRAARKRDHTPVDMTEVLEDSLKMVLLAVKTSPVEVVKRFEPVEKIEANAGELQQVFVNLITNAFHAMNGREGRLLLSTRVSNHSVEVKVGDNGTGIPPQHLKKIFDPFFTTKNPGEGTGLGLNIVYRIITNYEGTVSVESTEGTGTTFTMRFPVRRQNDDKEEDLDRG